MGVPEGEKRKEKKDSIFEEIVAKNIPNLIRSINLDIEETQRTQRFTPRDITVKPANTEDKMRTLKQERSDVSCAGNLQYNEQMMCFSFVTLLKKYPILKDNCIGTPEWFSGLSSRRLISARVMISVVRSSLSPSTPPPQK